MTIDLFANRRLLPQPPPFLLLLILFRYTYCFIGMNCFLHAIFFFQFSGHLQAACRTMHASGRKQKHGITRLLFFSLLQAALLKWCSTLWLPASLRPTSLLAVVILSSPDAGEVTSSEPGAQERSSVLLVRRWYTTIRMCGARNQYSPGPNIH